MSTKSANKLKALSRAKHSSLLSLTIRNKVRSLLALPANLNLVWYKHSSLFATTANDEYLSSWPYIRISPEPEKYLSGTNTLAYLHLQPTTKITVLGLKNNSETNTLAYCLLSSVTKRQAPCLTHKLHTRLKKSFSSKHSSLSSTKINKKVGSYPSTQIFQDLAKVCQNLQNLLRQTLQLYLLPQTTKYSSSLPYMQIFRQVKKTCEVQTLQLIFSYCQ